MPVTLALLTTLALAAAPNKQVLECVKASEAAQAARDELRYEAARGALAQCTAPGCPPVIQTDCAKWLSQLEFDQPSLVIVATRGGADVTDGFSVSVDDRPLESFRLGQPLRVDPGTRRVTVTLRDARTLTESLVVNVGERNRRVVFAFASLEPRTQLEPAPRPVVTLQPAERRAPVAPLLLTGGAVAGVATFAVLAIVGPGARSPVLSSPCAQTRTCDPALVQPARDLYLGADLALGAAIILAALATWQWISWAASP